MGGEGVVAIGVVRGRDSDVLLEGGLTFKTSRQGERSSELKSEDFRGTSFMDEPYVFDYTQDCICRLSTISKE